MQQKHDNLEWDREGADLHNQEGLEGYLQELEDTLPRNVTGQRIACHINDAELADKALEVLVVGAQTV